MAHAVLVVDQSLDSFRKISSSVPGLECRWVQKLCDAVVATEKTAFSLITLDTDFDDGDGFRFCSTLKHDSDHAATPVIFISSRTAVSDKVFAFTVGATDYITKPFEPLELQARINANLRDDATAAAPLKNHVVRIGELEFDTNTRRIRTPAMETPEQLTPKEFELLRFLVEAKESVVSRDEIISKVWGQDANVFNRTADVYVAKLRKKLGPVASYIESTHGEGYRFKALHAARQYPAKRMR